MVTNVSIDELRKVIALQDLPDAHLQWILDNSDYTEFEDDAITVNTGDPMEHMWIILQGRINFRFEMKGSKAFEYPFENDHVTQGISGMMPYSRMKRSPGTGVASGGLRVLKLHKDHFKELERMNPAFIQRLIAIMTDRARIFATRQLQEEKVSALGRLSAGIAHEINNPASAISQFAGELIKRLMLNYDLTEKLLAQGVSARHIGTIRALIESRNSDPLRVEKMAMKDRIAKEDEINGWLEANGYHDYLFVSETFADQGLTPEDFEGIRSSFGAEAFVPVLLWLENLVTSQRTIRDLEEASRRISKLVGAIKSHVHMDRTDDLQPTDIEKDIENTLTLLGYKIRSKNITVKRDFKESLPEVDAYVSELNQVWTNLIDNAIDALDKNGEITIRGKANGRDLHVHIIDNGPGIPQGIINRIFDPFFTTKKVGEGTGIGLDLVQRIIAHHHGDIRVHSAPGRTEFSICLPVRQALTKPAS